MTDAEIRDKTLRDGFDCDSCIHRAVDGERERCDLASAGRHTDPTEVCSLHPAVAAVERLMEVVSEGIESIGAEPCRLDRHGNCQEHGWTKAGGCQLEITKKALAAAREAWHIQEDTHA